MAMRIPAPPLLSLGRLWFAMAWEEQRRARSPAIFAADTFLAALSSSLAGEAQQSMKPQARLNAAIQAANHAVYQQSRQSRQFAGMGTTLVALLHMPVIKSPSKGTNGKHPTTGLSPTNHTNSRVTDPPTLWLGHVGDSRCYRYRRGKLEQLTNDHSLVEEQVRAGQITQEQAAESPMRNLITRAIGSQATVEAEIQGHQPAAERFVPACLRRPDARGWRRRDCGDTVCCPPNRRP